MYIERKPSQHCRARLDASFYQIPRFVLKLQGSTGAVDGTKDKVCGDSTKQSSQTAHKQIADSLSRDALCMCMCVLWACRGQRLAPGLFISLCYRH